MPLIGAQTIQVNQKTSSSKNLQGASEKQSKQSISSNQSANILQMSEHLSEEDKEMHKKEKGLSSKTDDHSVCLSQDQYENMLPLETTIRRASRGKNSSSKFHWVVFLLFAFLFFSGNSYILSISSSQKYTGVLSNYYFTLSNHTNPTNFVITFTNWSPTQDEPFLSTYQIVQNVTGNGISCIKRFRNIIECNISSTIFSGSIYPSVIVLKMSGIYNPSSLKPYPISVFLNNTSGSDNKTATLTVLQPRVSSFFIDNYSADIGVKSSAFVYLNFNNYFTSGTIMNLTYNSALVTMDMIPDSAYTVTTDVMGLKRLSNWNPATAVFKTLRMNVTNPLFAISYTLDGMLYMVDSGVEYKIERYTLTVQVNALSYSALGLVSPQNNLKMGVSSNNLSISSQCSVAGINNSTTKSSYFSITYDNSVISISNGSSCVSSSISGTTSTCIISIPNNAALATNSILITKINSMIPSTTVLNNVTIKVTSWSYFSTLAQFYSICSSTIAVDILPQPITPLTTLASCNSIDGQQNSLTFLINVENAALADTIVIKDYIGKIINKTASLPFTYNTSLNQYEGNLTTTQIINSTAIQLNISFTNPTFVPNQQPFINFQLYRKLSSNTSLSNVYAQTSSAVTVCPVASALSNSSNNVLTLSNQGTYRSNVTYFIQFGASSIQFKDYAVNDYVVVSFKNRVSSGANYAETESPFQLSSFASGTAPVVTINTQYNLPAEIISSSMLKITFNSTELISLINNQTSSTLLLTIKSLSNPFFVSDAFCLVKTYTSTNLIKQSLTTSSSSVAIVQDSELSLLTNSVITLVASNNTINLQVSSLSGKSLLGTSYQYISSLYYVIKTPFSCLNTNSTDQLLVVLPSMNTSSINITLNTCTLGYFADYTQNIQIYEYAKFSHTNLTLNVSTTSSLYPIKSTCGDQCHYCDTTTLKCTNCFNSTYNLFNYFYPAQGKCYQNCPAATYGNGYNCESCHPICSQCINSFYSSCTKCATNFIKNTVGICVSTCGANMFLQSNVCTDCDPNCQGCMNSTYCYACKTGAVLVGSSCIFSQCQAPCETCQGSSDNCLSCVSNSTHQYYFYENSCVMSCPSETFEYSSVSNGVNSNVCMKIKSSSVYFVGVILCLICLGIGVGIRCCAPKKPKLTSISLEQRDSLIRNTKLENKLTESYGNKNGNTKKQSQQNISKTQNGKPETNLIIDSILNKYLQASKYPKGKIYKLNLLRFMTVLMGYIEVVCALVILVSGGIYNPKGVNEMIFVGLAGLVITNVIFGIKYFKTVYYRMSLKRKKFIQIHINNRPSPPIQIQPVPIEPVGEENLQNNEENPMQQRKQENLNKEASKVNNTKLRNRAVDIFHSEKSSQNQESVTSEQREKIKLNKKLLSDFDNQMVKQLLLAILSTVFTLRTYNILRSNLFILFQSQNETSQNGKILNSYQSKNLEQAIGSLSALQFPQRIQNEIVEIKKTETISPRKNLPQKNNSKQSALNVIKVQPKDMKLQLNRKLSENKSQTKANKQQSLRNTNLSNQNLINLIHPVNIPEETRNPLIEIKTEYANRFLHPFYTYIMFASLFFVSLMFAIAAAIEIFNNRYLNMMFWGIDALIVLTASFLLNIFDLWKAVNLSRHQQHSEISTEQNQINQTMENLKNFEDDVDNIDLKVGNEEQNIHDLNATKKLNPSNKKNLSSFRASGSKSKMPQMKTAIKTEQIQLKSFSKSISPKSPSLKSDKTKGFKAKHKSAFKSSDNLQYTEEKPPQLKIFDDLQIQDNNVGKNGVKFQKGQKIGKQSGRSRQFSKISSSNRTLYGRKTAMSQQMQGNTTRGKEKGYKLDDIYLGFLQSNQGNVQTSEQVHRQISEIDQIETVKLESRDFILQNMKKDSIVNLNSEEEVYEDNEWKSKPLKVIESKKIEENVQVQEGQEKVEGK